MRLVVVVAALVVCFVDRALCQLHCAKPTDSDIENVISLGIRGGDASATANVDLMRFQLVCLAYSQERNLFRFVSALVEYTCTGNAACPDGTVVEQFESECVSGSWSHQIRESSDNTRTQMPIASFDTTELRENCAFCVHPLLAPGIGIPVANTPDDENHCVACVGCGETGQDRCTGINPGSCCNLYVDGMCDTDCPDDGIYITDPTTLECLEICPDLNDTVPFGTVRYSQPMPDGEEGYSEGTIATVECNIRYTGGGFIECESGGEWSPSNSLPSCEIVDCGPPPELDNGNVTFSSTLVDSVATYECDEDYFFDDDGTKTTRTCLDSGEWSNEDLLCKICELPDCKICVVVDGKPVCQDCNDGFEKVDSSCDEISGGGSDDGICVICIVIPIAIILAIILAVAVAIAVYAYYRWKHAPPTNLKEKDAEGINGVARNNPLYLDPVTVADEVEE